MQIRKNIPKILNPDALSLVLEQNYSRVEAAKSPGINANMLGRWVKEPQSDDGRSFRGNGKLTPEQEENRRLKVEVKRLKRPRKKS